MAAKETPQLSDGVYLNLPEEVYFAQKGRRGSTDLAKLFLQGEGWWWGSDLNPDHVDGPQESRTFGKALHAVVLEGEKAYERRFAIMPDKDIERTQHGDRFCDTVKDIMAALEKRGMNPKQGSKAWLMDYAKSRAPELVIWDQLIGDWKKSNRHKLGITAREDRQIRVMSSAVRDHPEIGELFTWAEDHVPLAEVSILYTDEHGIPRRVRLDEMLPLTTIDVKTLGNVGNRALSFFAGEHVAKMAYHVQMADHHVGRKWAYQFIQQGKIYDGTPDDERDEETEKQHRIEAAWLRRFPGEAPNWDYAWLFYQKPDAKAGHAPVIFPWGEDYGSDLHMRGIRCRHTAVETYRRCMAQFGPHEPWTRVEPLHTTTETAKHRVFLPPYVGGNDPVPGEEDYL